jgi:hypothetical protein
MLNYQNQNNQTLETTQLSNTNQNAINLNIPQMIQTPNMQVNPTNNPTFNQTFNPTSNPINNFIPTFNPQFNPQFNPTINQPVNVNIHTPTPVIEKKTTFVPLPKFGSEPTIMACPFCKKEIQTQVNKSMNIKAICTAIATFYVGFVLMQACNNKEIGCQDVEHSCPKCGSKIGAYLSM